MIQNEVDILINKLLQDEEPVAEKSASSNVVNMPARMIKISAEIIRNLEKRSFTYSIFNNIVEKMHNNKISLQEIRQLV